MENIDDDIFLQIISYIEKNPVFILLIMILFLIIIVTFIINISIKSKSIKKYNIFINCLDCANKISQILALLIGITFGYTAINAYDITKMKEEKELLKTDIDSLDAHISTMRALMTCYTDVLENKNNKIEELSNNISDIKSLLMQKEKQLSNMNKQKAKLLGEIKTHESTIENQYKIIFKKLFLLETSNTIMNAYIRNINEITTEKDMKEIMNRYMPSIYDIMRETLDTIYIASVPRNEMDKLKKMIIKELERDTSLRQYVFTYNDYSNGYMESLMHIYNHISIKEDGSVYINFPQNIMKTQGLHVSKVFTAIITQISACIDKALNIN